MPLRAALSENIIFFLKMYNCCKLCLLCPRYSCSYLFSICLSQTVNLKRWGRKRTLWESDVTKNQIIFAICIAQTYKQCTTQQLDISQRGSLWHWLSRWEPYTSWRADLLFLHMDIKCRQYSAMLFLLTSSAWKGVFNNSHSKCSEMWYVIGNIRLQVQTPTTRKV